MKNIILTTALLALSAPTWAGEHDAKIESVCSDAKEIAYASYINAQQGKPLSTTLVRLSSIYADDETTYAFMAQYAKTAYQLDAPPIDMTLKDGATTVAKISKDLCKKQLEQALVEVKADESDSKVGM